MQKNKIIVVVIFFVCTSLAIFAQSKTNNNFQKAVEFLLKEKLRITPEEYIQYLKTGEIPKKLNTINKHFLPVTQLNNVESVVSKDYQPESEISAAINPTDSNNIVISPIRMGSQYGDPDEMLLCPIYYTTNFGKSWHKSTFKNKLGLTGWLAMGGGDPALAFDSNGKLYLSWIFLSVKINGYNIDSVMNTMHWAYSTDKGVSWTRENNEYVAYTKAKYSQSGTMGLETFYDKEWLATDMSNGAYKNNLYLSLSDLDNTEGTKIKVYRKPDNSNEFDKQGALVSHKNYKLAQFSELDVDNNGYVHVIFFGNEISDFNSFYHSVSKDGGKTFEPETEISGFYFAGSRMIPGDMTKQFTGLNPQRLYPCPQFAIDKSRLSTDGNLYLTWTAVGIDQDDGNGLDVYFSKSTDGGKTWSKARVVNDNAKGMSNCQFYSSIAVNEDGVLVLSWYDRRDDNTDNKTDYYMTYSFDGGKTFIHSFKISSRSSDFRYIGAANGNFGIGEYNKLLTTKAYAIPVWADCRDDNGDVNVYSAFVPIKEKPDLISVERITPIDAGIDFDDITPNPANDKIKLSFNISNQFNIRFDLIDEAGRIAKTINTKSYSSGKHSLLLNISDIPNGMYLIKLQTDNNYAVQKLIIQR